MKLEFPKGFLWGAATSSHQIEGGQQNDWSKWEKANADRLAREAESKFAHLEGWKERFGAEASKPENYISGTTCDSWNRFEEDFDILKELHLNAYRFSIEWSRIEPEEGRFDEEAIARYRRMLESLRARNIEPFVTLWHWTLPLWIEEQGGVESRKFPKYFERYTRFVVGRLKDLTTHWITVNEPTSVIGSAYINGAWPPQKRSIIAAGRVYLRLSETHRRAYRAIHDVAPDAQVGFANILLSFEAYRRHSLFDHLAIAFGKILSNRLMLWLTRGHHDFLTAQYYFHNRLKFPKKIRPIGFPQTDLGWEIYPKGIYNVLDYLKSYGLPIYITENGLADADDTRRGQFIADHLHWVHRAIEEGADVRGYFYWSLLDNFEWDKGFWPRFGLVKIDYATKKRTIRPSARIYAKIAETNTLEISES